MLAQESDKLATSRTRGNRGYGIKKYALLRTYPSNMAAGGTQKREREGQSPKDYRLSFSRGEGIKKEKRRNGRRVPYGENGSRVGETYGGAGRRKGMR